MFIYINIISYYKLFLYFNLCLSVMLDSLSCLFTHATTGARHSTKTNNTTQKTKNMRNTNPTKNLRLNLSALSEWMSVVKVKWTIHISAISWRERVTYWWDDVDHCVLDQHTDLVVFLSPCYTVKQVSRYLYHATFCIMILISLHTKFVYKLFSTKWRILTMKTLSCLFVFC